MEELVARISNNLWNSRYRSGIYSQWNVNELQDDFEACIGFQQLPITSFENNERPNIQKNYLLFVTSLDPKKSGWALAGVVQDILHVICVQYLKSFSVTDAAQNMTEFDRIIAKKSLKILKSRFFRPNYKDWPQFDYLFRWHLKRQTGN